MKKVVLVLIALFTLPSLSTAEAKLANSFSIDLIHRDSPLSPFYNPSMNQTEVFRNAALRSISRANSFSHFIAYGNKAETVIIPNRGDYLMKIFIGNPPVESFVVADTGSTLIWVQCLPCDNCFRQIAPIFNPNKSSTYEVISCLSNSCDLLQGTSCGVSSQCSYYYAYGDGSDTKGNLAKDAIGFGSNGRMLVASLKTIFGCGHENTGLYSNTSTGIVGLGQAPLSLVSQLGNEIGRVFSYCLLPYWSKSTSKLIFGNQSTLTGREGVVSTPIQPKESPSTTLYFLNLEGISVDETKITTMESERNIIIDTGSTYTLLEKSFYDIVESIIKTFIDDEAIEDPPRPFSLCYRLATTKEVPDITFNFAGGADFRIPMFQTLDGQTTCLLMVPARSPFSIFGALAQLDFKVEYDIPGKNISFAPADCTKE